jgi:SAM-dependent methyltransferase
MHHADYALRVFQQRFARSGNLTGRGFAALELGPGDSLASAVIAAAYGATHTYLVDAGAFASSDIQVYRDTARYLRTQGLEPPDLDQVADVDGVLRASRASYSTRGLQGLREIPSASVDFIWSQAVLEHVRKREFLETMRECRRILKRGGVCSHQIDLRDHLGGALNNLRFGERVWESEVFAKSGFYTNRISFSQMLALFEQAGFVVEVSTVRRWAALPTPRKRLAQEFITVSDDELCVSGFEVLLR